MRMLLTLWHRAAATQARDTFGRPRSLL